MSRRPSAPAVIQHGTVSQHGMFIEAMQMLRDGAMATCGAAAGMDGAEASRDGITNRAEPPAE